jgi:hypothetical protein
VPIDLPRSVSENIDRFTGRVWLLPKLLEWWGKSDQRLLLLTGGPGTGKSMILAWLANRGPPPEDPTAHAQLAQLRELVKAAHFCQASTRNFTPQAFAESIANQLTDAVKGFDGALAATLADRVKIVGIAQAGTAAVGANLTGVAIGSIDLGTLGDELSFDRAFVLPLKKLYESGHSEPMLLLSDALDEAQTYTGKVTLPKLLSALADLPAGVRILATTRDDPDLLQFFTCVPRLDLIRDAAPDVDDVRNYTVQRLTKLDSVAEGKRVEFADRLVKQAKGVFLYAALVLDDLLKLPSRDLPDLETYGLPEGLSGFYHNALARELGGVRQPWSDRYRPLLGLVAVARGEGLSSAQLTRILNHDPDEVGDTLRRCKQYLSGELPDGPFQLFHKSFADFLLEDAHNVDYHINSETMHARIAEYYWTSYYDDWSKCDGYGIASLATHLYRGLQLDRLKSLINPQWMRVRMDRDTHHFDGFNSDLDLAWESTSKNKGGEIAYLLDIVRFALIRTSFNSISAAYPPAIIARAVEVGQWSLVRALSLTPRLSESAARVLYTSILSSGNLSPADRCLLEERALGAATEIIDPFQRTIAFAQLAGCSSSITRSRTANGLTQALAEMKTATTNIESIYPTILKEAVAVLSEAQENTLIDNALNFANNIKEPYDLRFALGKLAPWLKGGFAIKALKIARTKIDDAEARTFAELDLLPCLSATSGEEVKSELRQTACDWLESWGREPTPGTQLFSQAAETSPLDEAAAVQVPARVRSLTALLSSLVPYLDETDRRKLIEFGSGLLPNLAPEKEFFWLFTIAPILDSRFALTAIESDRRNASRLNSSKLTADLLGFVPREDKHRLVSETMSLLRDEIPMKRFPILRDLFQNAEEQDRQALLAQIIDDCDGYISSWNGRMEALAVVGTTLAAVLPFIPVSQAKGALQVVLRPDLRMYRDEFLALLAPKLYGELLADALKILGEIEDEIPRATALMAIGSQLSGSPRKEILRHALDIALQMRSAYQRNKFLAKLTPVLDGEDKDRAVVEGLRAAKTSEMWPELCLERFAPFLGGKLIDEGMEIVRMCRRRSLATALRSLATMATCFEGAAKEDLVSEVLEGISKIELHERSLVLCALAPSLHGETALRAWGEAKNLQDGLGTIQSLIEIARRLDGGARNEALALCRSRARAIEVPRARVEALLKVSRELTADARRQEISAAIRTARGIREKSARAEALATVAPILSGWLKQELLRVTVNLVSSAEAWRQSQVIRLIAPEMNEWLVDRVLKLAEAIDDDKERSNALSSLGMSVLHKTRNKSMQSSWLGRIGVWITQLRGIPRLELLSFVTEAVLETKVLGETELRETAASIMEICERWEFDPV